MMQSNLISALLKAYFLTSFIIAGFATDDIQQEDGEKIPDGPDVYSLHIKSNIRYRYAQTVVTSRIANPANISQEVNFYVVLPETAFITGFVMVVKGKEYKAYVKEKEAAKQEYQQALEAGQGAAHVEYSARDSNQFTVSLNVEPMSKVTFNLTYEEFLHRSLSSYKHEININPGQVVNDLSVTVDIEDISPIKDLKVPDLKLSNELKEVEDDNPLANIEKKSPEKYIITWSPTAEQQRELSKDGIKGQFIVKYDVDRSKTPQQILIDDGYFVHFFSQDDLPPLNKHVVFILDVSGSMGGRKLEQLQDAMKQILSDLKPKDFFSIVLFSETAKAWAPNKPISLGYSPHFTEEPKIPDQELSGEYIIPASAENIKAGNSFIEGLRDLGGTNIMAGLRLGLKLTNIGKDVLMNLENHPEPMIIFLTDGEPNIGESNPNKITEIATNLNSFRSPIFSLGFGEGADLEFLKKLSLQNSGFARNIYEASDATLQLKTFFKEVSSPLLSNVTFQYVPEQVTSEITNSHFDTFYNGSELVVMGILRNNSLHGKMIGRTPTGDKEFPFSENRHIIIDHIPDSPTPQNKTPGHLERMWAYKSIKQILDKNTIQKNDTLKSEALKLSLKYSFVTPLTSLVVVKPNETTSVETEKSKIKNVPGFRKYSNFAKHPQSLSDHTHIRGGAFHTFAGGLGGGLAGFPGPVSNYGAYPAMMLLPQAAPPPSFYGPPVAHKVSSAPHYLSTMYQTTTSKLTITPDVADGAMEFNDHGEYMTTPKPEYLNYTDVTWLANYTSEDGNFIQPPEMISKTDVISLNATIGGEFECAVNGTYGECKHFIVCILPVFKDEISQFIPYKCHIDPNYLGVCCPRDSQS